MLSCYLGSLDAQKNSQGMQALLVMTRHNGSLSMPSLA
ncbi:hypothetical protein L839_4350 [Mycobacterium avium MAV_120809_2495]|nr:hypothetical protein L839_4350 [Mycobacterium avium MAV_120809_2495]